ncbi:MAG: hypothetical protein ACRCY8_12565 [Dermatophilaceae bacterium]
MTHTSQALSSLSSRAAVARRTALAAAAASAVTVMARPAAATGRDPFPDTIALPDGIRPEGITSGPGTRFYVGSLADGRLVAGDLRTGTVGTLLPGASGRSLRGLFWDKRSGLVWAAGSVGTEGHVWAVDGRTGAVASDTVVPGSVFLNDLVVTRDAVWVTDSRVDRLTVIRLDRRGRATDDAPAFVALGGAWPAGDGSGINANGIRQLRDGSAVLDNSRVGGLWQVDPATGAATAIPVLGGPGIVGGDGLELDGRTLYVVRGSGPDQVAVTDLRRRGDGWVARWRGALTDDTLDVPATATVAAGFVWAVNARFGVANPDTASYSVTRLDPR